MVLQQAKVADDASSDIELTAKKSASPHVKMPTYIHFVRHAQGYHNLKSTNQDIPDPELTPLGREQCAELKRRFLYHAQVTHLVASPMRRTLQTCLAAFEPAVRAGRRVVALPEVQEISRLPCDVGSPPTALAAQFCGEEVDLKLVDENWTDKGPDSPWAPEMGKLEARSRQARLWLRELGAKQGGKDAHIVVVTHGGFMHFITQDFEGIQPERGTGWENAEYRTYEFAAGDDDEDARLKETEESWTQRRGRAIRLTKTEQMELRTVFQDKLQEQFDQIDAELSGRSAINGHAHAGANGYEDKGLKV